MLHKSVYMQGGLQPIHLAAQEGHLNVVKLLVKEFNVQADTAKDVKIIFHKLMCILFMMMCIEWLPSNPLCLPARS